jgi:VWFA-related protein
MKYLVSLLILVSITPGTIAPVRAQQQQQPAPDDVVRITTNLVQLDAVVTDKSGNQIKDLSPGDFEVLQDGKPQKIVSVLYVNTEASERTQLQTAEAKPSAEKRQPPAPSSRVNFADAARILTFVVDDGNCAASQLGMMASKAALEKFINEQMLPNDLVAIYQTRGGSSVLQQYTSDKAQLLRVARKIRWYPPQGVCSNEATGDFFDRARPSTFMKPGGVITNIESEADRRSRTQIENRERENQVVGTLGVLRYITRGLQRVAGRKTVFLLSDGIPLMSVDPDTKGTESNPTVTMAPSNTRGIIRDLIDAANRASVVINAIDVRGVRIPGLITSQDSFTNLAGPTGNIHATAGTTAARDAHVMNSQSGMYHLANETGGRFFDDMNNLDVAVRRVLNLEKGYYLIGYQPEAETFKGKKFNKIEIKVKRPELNVRARSGFIGVTDEELRPKKRTGDSELYEAIAAPLLKAGLKLKLTAFFGNTATEGSFIRTLLHVDGNQISFIDEPNGLKKAVFDVVAVTLNEKNEVIEEFNRTHTIRFPEANLEDISRNGLTYSADVPVTQPGFYNFRVAIRDASSRLLGSAGQQIEVPDLKKKKLHLGGLEVAEVKIENGKPARSLIEPSQGRFSPVSSLSETAIRKFQRGSILAYSYRIYNAALAKSSQQPNLSIQIRLYKDGEVVTDYPVQVIQLEPQTDLSRLADYGYMRLAPEMAPGDYALQLVIKDLNDKRTTSEWIDFEVVN